MTDEPSVSVKPHAVYMRDWRKTHKMSEEQRKHAAARSYLGVYIRRGKVQRLPCEVCGAEKAEGHHYLGYDHPLDVRWLCRPHHMAEHRP